MRSPEGGDGGDLLPEVIGHGPWKRYFARALAEKRLAHAYLLLGPANVGKWTFACALAKRIACASPRGVASSRGAAGGDAASRGAACGACGPCLRVAGGSHPDVSLIDAVAEGERGLSVETARERIVDAFRLRPSEAWLRVVAVNDADRMEPGAQNALLKTLEEPPSRSLLLLVSSNTSSLLDTVTSRCFSLRFMPVADDELVAALERRGVERAQARELAAHAGGLPGRAIEWTSGGSSLTKLAGDLLAGRVGAVEVGKSLAELADSLPEKSAFERRRQAALSFCSWLAAEARNQPMVGLADANLPAMLDDIAEAASELQAHATPELVMDSLVARLEK